MEQAWAPTWPPPMPTSLWADLNNKSWLMPEKKPSIWWRYIDDIFTHWNHEEESLNSFIGEINQAHPTIKFITEQSRESVSFLGKTVKLDGGRAMTDLPVKPTDSHQYLAANRCHPTRCKEAIPYSQALWMRRICSSDEAFNTGTTELKEHLTRHGYGEATQISHDWEPWHRRRHQFSMHPTA